MGLLDALISSLPSAPGTGFGPAVAGGGSAAAGAGGAPPGCGMGGPSDMGGPGGVAGPDEPDHTPGPEPYTPAHPPMSWDEVTGDATGTSTSGAGGTPASGRSGGDRFFHPREGGRSYVTVNALDRYGKWLQEGGPWTRAAKALTGLVLIPIGAVATCAENAIRSPLPG
jgi:hypothetical protein